MVASLTLFLCHSFGSSRRRLKASTNYTKGNKKMNFDEFKDQFTEDVKQALKDAGIDANKKGEHRMENTKSHTPVALRKQIGGTMYCVRVHFNENAKETMKDKIKRMLENDVKASQNTA